jgi:hypothetical protein
VGQDHPYRLNRGGDRQGNRALYLLAVGRMGWDAATKACVQRRTAEGRTKPEILRCLKRYIARKLYPVLLATTSTLVQPLPRQDPPRKLDIYESIAEQGRARDLAWPHARISAKSNESRG